VTVNRRYLIIATIGVAFIIAAAGVALLTMQPARPTPDASAPAPIARPEPTPAAAKPAAPAPAPPTARAPHRTAATPAAPAVAAPAPAAAAPTTGELHIDSDVPGAQVFVDRVFLGKAPVTASRVTPGSHTLNVTAPGYDGIEETLDVASGSHDVTVTFKVVRLNAAIDVVHKHRIGSCSGRLTATPRELRYETTDTNDAFRVPLADIQAFDIDYLKKNLSVKIHGKTYNFTDPTGNADPLFVFHRDVAKARARLAAGDPPPATE
jgi:PEGA domain